MFAVGSHYDECCSGGQYFILSISHLKNTGNSIIGLFIYIIFSLATPHGIWDCSSWFRDQPAGLYWKHSHHHWTTEEAQKHLKIKHLVNVSSEHIKPSNELVQKSELERGVGYHREMLPRL